MKRVAICAVAQHKVEPDAWYKRGQGLLIDVLDDLRAQTGFKFYTEEDPSGVYDIVSNSDDVFDARTISDCGMADAMGAIYRGEEKIAQDGSNTIGYAMSIIKAGHQDAIYVCGHCKESQSESRNMCTNLAYDPFYGRCLGLDFLNAAGLQARAYGLKSNITEEQLAKVVVRAHQWAAKNPKANELSKRQLLLGDVMFSPMLCDPIRTMHAYPVSDGAVAMLLASEETAHKYTDNPVWITGWSNCMDSYFMGDRDLANNFALKKAAAAAYKMAGITDPKKSIDLVELMDCYAYQQPMWLEGLGICEDGKGGEFIDAGGLDKYNVNLSGGQLAGAPLINGGLYRIAEAVLQLQGKAGEHQAKDVKRAVAHGMTGGAGQHQTVVVLEK